MPRVAPLGARAADLVVWWEKGFYAQEDGALGIPSPRSSRIPASMSRSPFYSQDEFPEKIEVALEAGQPPDFAFGFWLVPYIPKWAFEDRLLDLTDTVGHFSDLFDPD